MRLVLPFDMVILLVLESDDHGGIENTWHTSYPITFKPASTNMIGILNHLHIGNGLHWYDLVTESDYA